MENILEYSELNAFNDMEQIPDIDSEAVINDILGIEEE